MQTANFYQNELDKACFQHDIAYVDFEDLNRRTAADKLLSDKAFNIVKNPKHDGYQRGLLQWSVDILIITLWVEQLELKTPNNRKFNKRKLHLPFIENIWGADLADMQLISKFNKRFKCLLCVIDIYSKYACYSFKR